MLDEREIKAWLHGAASVGGAWRFVIMGETQWLFRLSWFDSAAPPTCYLRNLLPEPSYDC